MMGVIGGGEDMSSCRSRRFSSADSLRYTGRLGGLSIVYILEMDFLSFAEVLLYFAALIPLSKLRLSSRDLCCTWTQPDFPR